MYIYIYTLPQKGSWKVTFFFSPILRVLTTGKVSQVWWFLLGAMTSLGANQPYYDLGVKYHTISGS